MPWHESAAPYPRFKMLTAPALRFQANAMLAANPTADNFARTGCNTKTKFILPCLQVCL